MTAKDRPGSARFPSRSRDDSGEAAPTAAFCFSPAGNGACGRYFFSGPIFRYRVSLAVAVQHGGRKPLELALAARRVVVPGEWRFLEVSRPRRGAVPVVSFEVLITLFALAIGPINYLLLRRWKRLHLLVVTVPLGATAVTFALFGYALLTDGLGTRLRVRSLTRIDQHRGEAITWARLSYYSGLSPRGGLEFPTTSWSCPAILFPVTGRNESK